MNDRVSAALAQTVVHNPGYGHATSRDSYVFPLRATESLAESSLGLLAKVSAVLYSRFLATRTRRRIGVVWNRP
jgi:hypothetical protein